MTDFDFTVLENARSLTDAGKQVIVSLNELSDGLPPPFSRADLKSAIENLRDGGYIDVKYSSGDTYCLAVKTPPENDHKTQNHASEKRTNLNLSLFFVSALGALFGSATGSAIVAVISAVL